MGVQRINSADGGQADRVAMQRVLRDLDAMEWMLEHAMFETDRRRIGVEQELFLVDGSMQPAPIAESLLERIDDERVVPEIARFNLEFNCDPIDLDGPCLAMLEAQLATLYGKVDAACRSFGARALMTGICPTVDLSHLTTDNIMPNPRYHSLDAALRKLRGDDYELHIDGADELSVRHPSVMLESVNTSFQVHFQTTPGEFAGAYNVALAVAAPVLAAAVNSPMLFGRRLWRETRIATFQQSVDTRGEGVGHRDFVGRVRFGEAWVESSVLEVLRADVARFRQLLYASADDQPDPIEELKAGRTPKLASWQAFNSSVYRWMRPCYGVTDGRPHLRIENRVLPSGPTMVDEVANAAFWIGLMVAGPAAWPDVSKKLGLGDARNNFLRAARDGLSAHMAWLDGRDHPIAELILQDFLPVARNGLDSAGVNEDDVERMLGIIEARVSSGRTGSRWILDAASRAGGSTSHRGSLSGLTRAMLDRQDRQRPVHEWNIVADEGDDGGASAILGYARVSQCMTTDLFTVGEGECIDLVASIMDWEHVRHIPVEDAQHRLVGIVSYRKLLRVLTHERSSKDPAAMPVSEIMVRDPVTVAPDTPTLEAIRLMGEHRVACLPVVENERLVGIVSDRDYAKIARTLLERALRETPRA
ncbi:MAG: CBS domain-containing protein [Phycisphaerales bacterium]|jgi:CBS domain-containing protein